MKVLFLAFLLIPSLLFSQAREEITPKETPISKNRLGFNIGLTDPRGDFADTDASSEKSGFASPGLDINLNFQHEFAEYFALSAHIGHATYKVDVEAIETENRKFLGFGFPGTIKAISDDYSVSYLLVGIKGIIGEEVKLYLNPYFGTSYMSSPNLNVIISYNGSSVSSSQENYDTEFVLTYGVNLGAYIPLTKELNFNINANYMETEYEIKPTVFTNVNGVQSRGVYSYKQPFQSIGITIGLGISF